MPTNNDYWGVLDPAYVAWLQTHSGAIQKVFDLMLQAKNGGWSVNRFLKVVEALPSFTEGKWKTAETPPGEEPTPTPEETAAEEPTTNPASDYLAQQTAASIRGAFQLFLQQNGLPSSLMSFIEGALGQKWSYDEIIAKLRETPEYLAAYPENRMRQEAGLSWWPEEQIREYRDRARWIAKTYLGLNPIDVSNEEIASLVAKGVDLGEWERRIITHAQFLQWGPVVKQALSQELGYDIPDDRVWAFMNPDIPTPELDLAYKRAMMRGQPAVLGFGIRPSEEADILVQMGFSPEQAFQGYQGIAEELPRVERMRMIEEYLNGQQGMTPTNPLGEASYGLLFRALMMRDVQAHDILTQMLARETAAWQAGGGPAGGGAGLLTAGERAA